MKQCIVWLKRMVGFYTKENRFLTFMMVPHSGCGIRQVKVPVARLKISATILIIVLMVSTLVLLDCRQAVVAAQLHQRELYDLRNVNQSQTHELEELQHMTAMIQQRMDGLNELEQEVRRKLGLEQQPISSRFGVERLMPEQQGGKGGPLPLVTTRVVGNQLQQLQYDVEQREQNLRVLLGYLQQKEAQEAVTPSIWPVDGQVTSGFGYRQSPFGGRSDFHPGIDIAAAWGTPVVATADGVVQLSGWVSGYGNFVEIKHDSGVTTCYGHNSANLVAVGQQVKKGQVIAKVGSTGYSTGAHVHYEVRVNGSPVNPIQYLH